jgi:hypothetical protein
MAITMAVKIVPTPVEPDEFVVDPGTVSVYLATVVHAIRGVDDNNISLASEEFMGAVETVSV